jgi:hypothetical protein
LNEAVSISGQRMRRLAKEAANATDGESALRTLNLLREELAELERQQVAWALAGGCSYGDVARALGVSRQAAHRRFRHLAPGQRAASLGPLPASAEVRLVVDHAGSEARALGAKVVEPPHLLLGILRAGDRRAAPALRSAGVTLEGARREAAAATPTPPLQAAGAATRHALGRSVALARRDRAECLEVEHLLRGVLEGMDCPGSLLRRLKVPARRILEALEADAHHVPAARAIG